MMDKRDELRDAIEAILFNASEGAPLVDIASDIVSVFDAATASEWTACKDAMPEYPMHVWVVLRHPDGGLYVQEGVAQWLDGVAEGTQIEFVTTGVPRGFLVPVEYWMPRRMPAPPAKEG
jgi:hypothetical protein